MSNGSSGNTMKCLKPVDDSPSSCLVQLYNLFSVNFESVKMLVKEGEHAKM